MDADAIETKPLGEALCDTLRAFFIQLERRTKYLHRHSEGGWYTDFRAPNPHLEFLSRFPATHQVQIAGCTVADYYADKARKRLMQMIQRMSPKARMDMLRDLRDGVDESNAAAYRYIRELKIIPPTEEKRMSLRSQRRTHKER